MVRVGVEYSYILVVYLKEGFRFFYIVEFGGLVFDGDLFLKFFVDFLFRRIFSSIWNYFGRLDLSNI